VSPLGQVASRKVEQVTSLALTQQQPGPDAARRPMDSPTRGLYSGRRDSGEKLLLEPLGAEQAVTDLFTGDSNFSFYAEAHAAGAALLKSNIVGRNVLVVPAYSSNAFLFRTLGAREVVGIDADGATIGALTTVRDYFFSGGIGPLLMNWSRHPEFHSSTTELPELQTRPGATRDEVLRTLLQTHVELAADSQPLHGIEFKQAALGSLPNSLVPRVGNMPDLANRFDFIYVPYLLAIANGVSTPEAIHQAVADLYHAAAPGAKILITPFSNSEAQIQRYFGASDGVQIQDLKGYFPTTHFRLEQEFFCDGAHSFAVLAVVK
jgi:hypothetical protein